MFSSDGLSDGLRLADESVRRPSAALPFSRWRVRCRVAAQGGTAAELSIDKHKLRVACYDRFGARAPSRSTAGPGVGSAGEPAASATMTTRSTTTPAERLTPPRAGSQVRQALSRAGGDGKMAGLYPDSRRVASTARVIMYHLCTLELHIGNFLGPPAVAFA